MANPEHLAILQQGVAVWNAWRQEDLSVEPQLRDAQLQGLDLTGFDFLIAHLQGANLSDTDLQGANLTGAYLRWAKLTKADLAGANLTDANLFGVDLRQTNLSKTNFTRADFTRADLAGATFIQTSMTNAVIGWTIFGDVNFEGISDLNTIEHVGPSTIGIDTLYRSQGQIPEVFLRGCGVPDSMIEYARSLVAAQRPIDYYSVFISYNSQDEAIAQCLHADLQAAGVRCWFAPHDLEIGAPIVRGIDEAIRIYDKLLIILSEAAVTSRWVDFEVSTALHREVEQGRTMLFPIRLDDTVLHTPSGWAAQLRTRNIGDFRGWKDHDSYQAVFTRLLRDLKAKG